MRTFLASSLLCLGLGAGFWYALTSSLTDLTIRDCRAGVTRACGQLQTDGHQFPLHGPATAERDQ